MKTNDVLSERELRELRSWFEPTSITLISSPFDRLCNALLKTAQLFIDAAIMEKQKKINDNC